MPCTSYAADTAEYGEIAAEYLTGRCVIKRSAVSTGEAAGSQIGGVRRAFSDLAGHDADPVYPGGVPCQIEEASAPAEVMEGMKAAEASTHNVYFPLALGSSVKRRDRIYPKTAGQWAGFLSVIGVNEEETDRTLIRARCVLNNSEAV